MGSFSELSGNKDFQNGGPHHKFIGIENPAYKPSEPLTIPTGSLKDDFLANHLVYHNINNEDDITNNFTHTFNSSKNDGYNQNSATMRTSKSVVNTLKSVNTRNSLSKLQSRNKAERTVADPEGFTHSQTLRRSAPATSNTAAPFGTISRAALYDGFPKQVSWSEKSSSISLFDLETDKVSSYQYRPGEEVTGRVTIVVRKSVEIRFVELIVTGQGQITVRKSVNGVSHTSHETYLQKQKCIIGSHDGLTNSVMTPGHYVSKFNIRLPTDLPATLHHENVLNGFTFDIIYSIRVRMCDDVIMSPLRRASNHGRRVRVFLEKQIRFNVLRGFDLNTVPDAMSPIIHTEQVQLACADQQAAIVSVNIDRAVFLAGDDIGMRLHVALPKHQTLKEITCKFQQLVAVHPKQEMKVFTISKVTRADPSFSVRDKGEVQENIFDLTLPTSTSLISPNVIVGSKVKIEYFLTVELRFTPAGGKLFFKVPIGIGPCADPIYAEKTVSKKIMPVFNRSMRFPMFSTKTLKGSSKIPLSNVRKPASVQVITKYSSNWFTHCFSCCLGSRNI